VVSVDAVPDAGDSSGDQSTRNPQYPKKDSVLDVARLSSAGFELCSLSYLFRRHLSGALASGQPFRAPRRECLEVSPKRRLMLADLLDRLAHAAPHRDPSGEKEIVGSMGDEAGGGGRLT
jgi:hypothetical protein